MKMKRIALALALVLLLGLFCGFTGHRVAEAEGEEVVPEAAEESDVVLSDDASDFVLLSEAVPDAILEIRYYSTYNFVGDRIDGYEEPLAFLTKEAAAALKEVSDELVEQGYRLKIFDAYRPQKAVTHFMNWALDSEDTRMKEYFYPELDKDVLFPQGYIAEHSGHSRGSTVDLTLFDMATEKEVDMGGTFDYFGELSHPDYTDITEEQYANRMILRDAMLAHGFKPLEEEWWHFTLEDEPYPDTYFTFPVNSDSVAAAVTIDYGTSALYSQEEMDEAIALIEKEFSGWEGCELHSIWYGSDDCNSEENIQWLNELKEGQDYTQCIEFLSDFHSPVEGGGAWEADMEYTDYQWWLARSEGGAWELLTWGY